jgi:ribose-phosphate pyrophosphokinase
MSRTITAGSANVPLAQTVVDTLGVRLGASHVHRFPDGELRVQPQECGRGHDVYPLQPTGPPIETHLLELLLLADACRRAGAAHLTAVVIRAEIWAPG